MAKQPQKDQKTSRRFFLPFATDEKVAEEAWQSIRKFAEETTGWSVDEDQRIFSIAFTHNGEDYYAEVGQPEPQTGEPVIAILSSTAYLVCTPNHGVIRGMPLLVGYKDTFGLVPFSDFKGVSSKRKKEVSAK
jgi:hypothetical protein